MTANSIYLRHKSKVLVPVYPKTKHDILNIREISTFLHNLEQFGFIPSDDLLKKLVHISTENIHGFYLGLIKALKKSIGAHVKYKPMYPNFPKQVMEASEAELYLNAVLHYFGDWLGVRIMPEYKKEARSKLDEDTKLKRIGLGNPEEFGKIFTDLVGAKTSISAENKKELEWFIKTFPKTIHNLFPKEIPLKENKALIAKLLLQYTDCPGDILTKYFKTATDVLRFAVVLSDGDVSLASNTEFKSFSNPERTLIKTLTEQCNNITEDMLKYKESWKRLNEKLHVFQHHRRFPKLRAAMKVLVEDQKFTIFNSSVEKCLEKSDTIGAVEILKKRPGELARRLDHLLRITHNPSFILDAFAKVVDKISTPVLWQVMTHFKHRNDEKEIRVFFPKGNVSKAQAIVNNLVYLNQKICDKIVFLCKEALVSAYKNKKPLKGCFISKELKNYTIPFAMRSVSRSLKTIARGSKIDLPEKNILRLFLWWKDGKERTDIDLSVLLLDEKFECQEQVSYDHLRCEGVVHSGDITSAPKGASEFIDLDQKILSANKIRYAVVSINSFTNQPFYDLPECFMGMMGREKAQSGEIYEPKTVKHKFDLTANTQIAIPMIFDLIEKKMVWTDLSLTRDVSGYNNVLNNMSSLEILTKAMLNLKKPNLYDLFSLHVAARGHLVEQTEDVDVRFGLDGDVTPFDIENIIANFL